MGKIKIRNYDESIEKLEAILKQSEKDCKIYNVDVYGYLDYDVLTLEEFENPGGNSWLADDHILVHTMQGYLTSVYDKVFEAIDEDYQLAEAFGMDEETLYENALIFKKEKENRYETIDDIGRNEIEEYLFETFGYEKFDEILDDIVENGENDYYELACDIIDELFESI